MSNALILTAPQAMTAPLPGTPTLRMVGDRYVLASDNFTGSNVDPITARISNAYSGGTQRPWQLALSGGFAINSNALRASTTPQANSMLLELPAAADLTVSARVDALPTSGAVAIICRRNALSGMTEQLRLLISATDARIAYNLGGASDVVLASTAVPAAAGQVWGIREYRGLVEVFRDGQMVHSRQMEASFGGSRFCGVSAGSGNVGWVLDNFTAAETIR